VRGDPAVHACSGTAACNVPGATVRLSIFWVLLVGGAPIQNMCVTQTWARLAMAYGEGVQWQGDHEGEWATPSTQERH